MKLKVLDLFSGIGGFSLGLERTGGFETVAFCEIDPFCQKVLKKHWPDMQIFDDMRTLTHEQVGAVDVICGGFPCQDISVAGKGAGIDGERSGLWKEFARLIGDIRPKYVLVENVAALLGRGLGRVLGDLAEIGYDAEWYCIPASAVGAPHRRDRVWIIAYPKCDRSQRIGTWENTRKEIEQNRRRKAGGIFVSPLFAEAISGELSQCRSIGRVGRAESIPRYGHWKIASEPFVRRRDHGISHRSYRLKSLGNAVVPKIPEIIGRAILKSMEAS